MTENHTQVLSFEAYELQKYEPNRYPFLLIDKITECVPGKYAKGYKNLTNNEWFFSKNRVEHAIMPNTLLAEALNQILTIAFTTMPGVDSRGVTGCKYNTIYHKEICPGDRLEIEGYVKSYTRGLCRGYAKGYVDGEIACEVETTMMIPSIFNQFRPPKRQGK